MYISKETLNTDWGLHKFLLTPYGEGIINFKKTFSTEIGSSKTLGDRVKHFIAGVSLIIPIINGIALYILSGLTQSIEKQNLYQELERLKKITSEDPEQLIKDFGYGEHLFISKIEGKVTGNTREFIVEKDSQGRERKDMSREELDHNLAKLMIFGEKLFKLDRKEEAKDLVCSGGTTYGNGDGSSIRYHRALLKDHVSNEFATHCLGYD